VNAASLLRAVALSIALASSALAGDPATVLVVGPSGQSRSLNAADLEQMSSREVTVTDPHGKEPARYRGVSLIQVLASVGTPVGDSLRGKMMALHVRAEATEAVLQLERIGPDPLQLLGGERLRQRPPDAPGIVRPRDGDGRRPDRRPGRGRSVRRASPPRRRAASTDAQASTPRRVSGHGRSQAQFTTAAAHPIRKAIPQMPVTETSCSRARLPPWVYATAPQVPKGLARDTRNSDDTQADGRSSVPTKSSRRRAYQAASQRGAASARAVAAMKAAYGVPRSGAIPHHMTADAPAMAA
jgi:hypothetical protein